MNQQINKSEAQAFRKRWDAVNAADKKELRKISSARKFRQLSSLITWGRYFGWMESGEDGVAEVRKRWNRLFHIYRG